MERGTYMEVKLYDIGRADCILLGGKNKVNFMIDCGVQKYSSKLKEINNDLLKGKKNSLLITHFHSDHIRGLNYIHKNVFKDVYLSRFGLCLFKEEGLKTIEIFLKLFYYTPSNTYLNQFLRNILTILNMLSRVLVKKGNITFINSGSRFKTLPTFEVIHPDINCNMFLKDEFLTKAKEHIKFVEKTYKELLEASDYNAILNEEISKYKEATKLIFENQNTDSIAINDYLDELKNMENAISKISEIGGQLEEFAEYEELYDGFKKYMNYYSVVIHNSKALFCGDATKEVINDLFAMGLFKSNYRIIKTPHHGSSTSFTLSIPRPLIYLSCSDSSKDIKKSNMYLNSITKPLHIFSNGDAFIQGKIVKGLFTPDVKVNI